jgi:hypothetical protein
VVFSSFKLIYKLILIAARIVCRLTLIVSFYKCFLSAAEIDHVDDDTDDFSAASPRRLAHMLVDILFVVAKQSVATFSVVFTYVVFMSIMAFVFMSILL